MSYPAEIRIIAGQFRARKISVLTNSLVRPTPNRVRETLFNWLQPRIVGARCLDCFAGTGILGFEALSRGAAYVSFLENMQETYQALKKTSLMLGLDQAQYQIIYQDAIQWLKELKQKPDITHRYDIIFLDPPFNSDLLMRCLNVLDKHPLLSPDAWIYIEMPATLSLTSYYPWIPFKSKIAGQVGYHLFKKS